MWATNRIDRHAHQRNIDLHRRSVTTRVADVTDKLTRQLDHRPLTLRQPADQTENRIGLAAGTGHHRITGLFSANTDP